MGKYEVTQGEWASVMGQPIGLDKHRFPKADISWYDSVEFCNKLSEREMLPPYYDVQVKAWKGASIEEAEVTILSGIGYHIPTNAEWEPPPLNEANAKGSGSTAWPSATN